MGTPRHTQSKADLTVKIQSQLATDEADRMERRMGQLGKSKAAYIRDLILADLVHVRCGAQCAKPGLCATCVAR